MKFVFPLILLAAIALPAQATDIPESVADVSNIHHPNEQHFTGGQPTAEQLNAFRELGVRHLVDLRPPEEAPELNGAAQTSRAGLAYYHIPIAGGDDLTRDHVAVLDTILERIGGEKAVLHCASSNRVGAMMALHAAWHEGMSQEDALQLGRDYGMTSLESHVVKQLNN
ncbi:fused DSP-PTPase phosphatase/NAD kinase-like protein [Aliidiomarina sp. Khilg15.8]